MKMPHPEFGTWYSTVDLGDSQSRLEKRSTGMSKVLRRLSFERARHMVDLMLAEPNALEGVGADFVRSAFRDADPTFPVSGNGNEMALLAEIALAIAMDKRREDALAGRIAELVFSSLANGAREFSSVTDILPRARDIIQRQGRLLRRRPRLPTKPKTYVPPVSFESCFSNVDNLADRDQALAFMNRVSTRISKSLQQVANTARREREALEDHVRLQDEELDLLWWATTAQSATLHKLFSELEPGARTFLAAKEAADRTQFLPGPSSILGLMEKAGVSAETAVSLKDVLSAIEPTWLESEAFANISIRMPMHMAISMKRESADSTTWIGHWSARTGIDIEVARREIEIAEMFYHERLLLGAYGDIR